MKVMLLDSPADPVRLAFLHVFSKRDGFQNADGTVSEPKYEATPIFSPDGANAKRVNEAIAKVCAEKYGDKPTPVIDADGEAVMEDGKPLMLPAWKAIYRAFVDDQKGIRKGNLKKQNDGTPYDGFAGMVYVNPKNKTRPGLYDRDTSPLAEEDGRPYSGCYGNVEIDIWALAKQNVKKRVVIDLLGIQFTRDGDAFGSGSTPSRPTSFSNLSAADDDTPASKNPLD